MILEDELKLLWKLVVPDEQKDVLVFEVRLIVYGQLSVVGLFVFTLENLHERSFCEA